MEICPACYRLFDPAQSRSPFYFFFFGQPRRSLILVKDEADERAEKARNNKPVVLAMEI
jgi:hypothetical protein